MAKHLNAPPGELVIPLGLGDVVIHVIKQTGEVNIIASSEEEEGMPPAPISNSIIGASVDGL